MTTPVPPTPPAISLIDMVFPGDANHHGTLFGGQGLAHMDKIAFLAASRYGRRSFVTASCEQIDFSAPARIGEMIEACGHVVRVGRTSLSVQVALHAEALLDGERRLCTQGVFHMVSPKDGTDHDPLPPLPGLAADDDPASGSWLKMVEMVFPGSTNHYGTLFGGDALRMMGKAAFIAATRYARAVIVMAASRRIDFTSQIDSGDMVELRSRIGDVGRSSMTVQVELWAEALLTGVRRRAAEAEFVMVCVGPDGRPKPLAD